MRLRHLQETLEGFWFKQIRLTLFAPLLKKFHFLPINNEAAPTLLSTIFPSSFSSSFLIVAQRASAHVMHTPIMIYFIKLVKNILTKDGKTV
jgi:hypothetical protein